jgi:hypothetical protein
MVRGSRVLSLFIFVLTIISSMYSQQPQPVQIASLRPSPDLRWQRTSPTAQTADGPVLYQLVFTPGITGRIAKFDSNPRHFTSSDITDNGGIVGVGGLTINAGTGMVSFVNGQTFPGVVSGVAAGNSSITIGGTASAPTVAVASGAATSGQILTANGSGGVSFLNPTSQFPKGVVVDAGGSDNGTISSGDPNMANLLLFGTPTSGEGISSDRTGAGCCGQFSLVLFTNYNPRLIIMNNGDSNFNGNLGVVGNFSVGGTKNFRIDDPLAPAEKYLTHASIESSEVLNLYSGNVILDKRGRATVELPRWMEAENKDFRYQLTCIGGFARIYVAKKIEGNRFGIAGGRPGMEVSWQITGVRNDAYAKAHPMVVEEDKPADKRGTYVYPDAFEKPETAVAAKK